MAKFPTSMRQRKRAWVKAFTRSGDIHKLPLRANRARMTRRERDHIRDEIRTINTMLDAGFN